jgi:hypothetical protein
MGAANSMKVKLEDLFFNYGLLWIGIASLLLIGSSIIMGPSDASTVKVAGVIGLLIYVGCWIAKIEYNNEKKLKEKS